MAVVSFEHAVAAASHLFGFGARGIPPRDAEGPDTDSADEDGEADSVFTAVEAALREAGYLDA